MDDWRPWAADIRAARLAACPSPGFLRALADSVQSGRDVPESSPWVDQNGPVLSVGFTGTRRGFTETQKATFVGQLNAVRLLMGARSGDAVAFHHGDCCGADAEAHELVRRRYPNWTIHVHPGPNGDDFRAHMPADVMHDPKTHFARNRDIVHASQVVVGVSLTDKRLERGGTWYTLDYAVKRGKLTIVLWPDGRPEVLYGDAGRSEAS